METNNINPDKREEASKVSDNLNKITPLSKYLAMALFIALPFVGGWIGYAHAPVKVIEVERVVTKQIESERMADIAVNTNEQTERPFEKTDRVFILDDIQSEIEVVLSQDQVWWREANLKYVDKSDYWREWNSFTVSNPANLEYLGQGLFADGMSVYQLDMWEAISVPDSIQLDASQRIDVFTEEGVTFIENGEQLFVYMSNALLGSDLVQLPGFNRESMAVLEHGYITDGTEVYSLHSVIRGEGVKRLGGVNINNFTFHFADDSQHPSNVFVVSENKIYFQDLLLENIDFEDAEFLKGNTIVKDVDTVWFASGGCHYKTYREGSLDEIDEYVPPC